MKNFIVTGPPRTGKSTLIQKLLEKYRRNPKITLGGISTPEIKENNKRIGFRIIALHSNEVGIMAHENSTKGSKISKYRVNVNVVDLFSRKSLDFALNNANLVFLDEIGKMELFSIVFIEKVRAILDSKIPFIGTMGIKINHPFISEINGRDDVEFLVLSRINFDNLLNELENKIDLIMKDVICEHDI